MSATPRFLVTGASGCLGVWIVRDLLARSFPVTTLSRSPELSRLHLLLEPPAVRAVSHVVGDVCDMPTLESALDEHDITHVIHLAAALVPECQRDPAGGARTNVIGTLNVFEAARRRRDRLAPVVYASSAAAFDRAAPTMVAQPSTHYGVFKRANEASASVYWASEEVASVGLRPFTVYGIGRDQGLTSVLTRAMLAAAAGTTFTIPYGGRHRVHFAGDAAQAFIEAGLNATKGAAVHNLPGPSVSVPEFIEAIAAAAPESRGAIDFTDTRLPFPEEADSRSFADLVPGLAITSLQEGVRQTIEAFRALLGAGMLAPPPA
jgi:UDP-glucuronate 4-epimerase